MEGIVILASCEYHFLRVHENLVQHQSNKISINNIDKLSILGKVNRKIVVIIYTFNLDIWFSIKIYHREREREIDREKERGEREREREREIKKY